MKKTGIGLLLLSTTVTVGLAVAVGAGLGDGFFNKLVADGNDHSTTITAQEIGAALEASGSKAADFVHEGLTWHVDGATYDANTGLVNISGGVLYNVTMAGVDVDANGKHGSGFRSFAIYDMDSKTGANSFSFNKDAAMIAEHPIGAIADAKYTCDFSGDNDQGKGYVARYQFAFGAGDGTFFSAIELGYQCEEAKPELTISLGGSKLNPGEHAFLSYEAKNGEVESIAFYGSDDNVIIVNETTGEVAAKNQGNATITAIATFVGDTVVQSNELAIEVTNNKDIAVMYGMFAGGEGDLANHKGEIVYFTNCGMTLDFAGGKLNAHHTPGPNWWSNQLFYTLPHHTQYDTYTISFVLESDVAGAVQINGEVFNLEAGVAKQIRFGQYTAGAATGCIISIQFGTYTGETQLPAGTLSLSQMRIYDLNNPYYQVKFKNDSMTVHTELVKNKKSCFTAPEDPVAPTGQVFKGWFDESGNKFSNSYIIDKDTVFHSEFEDAGTITYHSVKIYWGDDMIQEFVDFQDGDVLDVSKIGTPLFYKVYKLYTDKDMEHEYDVTAPVTTDLDLYVRYAVKPDNTYTDWGSYYIPEEYTQVTEDNGWRFFNYEAPASGNKWQIQVNFTLPQGDAGVKYQVSFDYKINLAGGNVQIWDGWSAASSELAVAENYQHISLVYTGALTATNKLTFELAGLNPQGSLIDFTINNFALIEVIE